jgi:hypothetical protein
MPHLDANRSVPETTGHAGLASDESTANPIEPPQ